MNHAAKKTVVITGGTSGIGFQSALGIAKTGARVLITGRNAQRGVQAVERIKEETKNNNVELVVGDVSSIRSIDALALSILNSVKEIDVLINNAGYLGNEPSQSDDGLEMHFAVNVLAPWRLTHALLSALSASPSARVINVTGGDKPAAIDVDNLQAEKGFRGLMTYTHSKSILESMTMILARKLEDSSITVIVVFPGRASTNMTASMSSAALPGVMKLMYPLLRLLFKEDGGKSAAKAARSSVWAATTSDLDTKTGCYFDTNTKEQQLHPTAYEAKVQAAIVSVIETAEAG